MSKRPVYVTITIEKDGRATFEIDKPGPASKQTKSHKYSQMQNAWRGAMRQLGAVQGRVILQYPMTRDQQRAYFADLGKRWGIREVKRIIVRK